MSEFIIAKGRMAVYSPEHELQEQRLYYTREGMKKIMAAWMKQFSKGYYIQVRPYEDPPKVKQIIRLEITGEVKEKIERPPAVYNNIPFNYGSR